MFVIQPITKRILSNNPKKNSLSKRITHAIIFLAVVTLAQITYSQWDTWGENYYELMDLPRGAPVADVKRAYKRLSRVYHPDKYEGDAEEANAMFIKIKRAYDLSNAETNGGTISTARTRVDGKGSVDEKAQASQQIMIFFIIGQ